MPKKGMLIIMLSKTLSAALQNIGLTLTDSHAFGIYGGYLLTVYENGNKKTAFFNFLLDENEENEDSSLASFEISEAIKSNLETYSIIDYELQDDGLSVTSGQNIQKFLEMIDFCTELLKEYSVKGSENCCYCGKKFDKKHPKKVTKSNKNYLLCEACTLEVLEEHNKPAEEKSIVTPAKSRFLGIIGAIIGGLLGVLFYYATYQWLLPLTVDLESWDFRYVVTAYGFVTALFVYLGYKLFCKKASLTAYISIPLISIIFTAIGQYIGTIVYISTENSFNLFKFPDFGLLLMMPLRSTAENEAIEYSSSFYFLLAISIALAVVGAIIFLLGFYEKNRIVKEDIKVETLKIQQA